MADVADVADVADGETLLHSFVATLTAIASDRPITLEGEHFTVAQDGGERVRFAVPKCIAGPHSLTISNWSFKAFKLFFDVTENSCLLYTSDAADE